MEPIQLGRWWRLAGQAGTLNVLWRDWDPFERGPIVIPGEYDCVTGPLATGVGFVTKLDTDVERAPVRPGRLCVGDVTVTIDGLERGAGFVLFVEDGVLDTLEGFTYDEPWPDVIGRYEVTAGGISHSGGSKTDVEQVDEAWSPSDDIPAR